MNARLRWWVHEWDWRPLARLLVWLSLGVLALKRTGFHPPGLGRLAGESLAAFLLTGGLMTYAQLWALGLATNLYFWLDGRTYALAERFVRPVVGRAHFAVGFLAALAAQLGIVLGGLACCRAAHLVPHLLTLIDGGFLILLRAVT